MDAEETGGRPSIARCACVGLLLMAVSACSTPRSSAAAQQSEQQFAEARAALVQELRLQGIESEEVLAALGRVPRERFVPSAYVGEAYGNHPLPIGHGQMISPPTPPRCCRSWATTASMCFMVTAISAGPRRPPSTR